MTRTDLLALTGEALAALTNRGLVKRATKEVAGGTGPEVRVDADTAVTGSYPDGTTVVLPAGGGLEGGTCTCPATGTCRHLVALVLAYQGQAAAESTPPLESESPNALSEPPLAAAPTTSTTSTTPAAAHWSPGDFTDAQLEELVGARALAMARRTLRSGFTAKVRRPSPDDPVPSVELAACQVRFLVPHQLAYAHTDAAAKVRDRVIPLAVWAFRLADEQAPDVPELQLDIGGGTTPAGTDPGLGAALALADEILLDGVVHSSPALAATIAKVRGDLDAAGLRWPLLAVEDLDDQLAAYRERRANYRAEHVASVIAELHARHQAVTAGTDQSASPRSRVLGTREAANTPLRRVHLTGLGCRVTAGGLDPESSERGVDVFLAHPETSSVLVLRRSWPAQDGVPLSGYEIGRRRVGTVRVNMLASGDVVSESAVRSASRMVRLATSGVARSSGTPFGDNWDTLPDGLLVRDLGLECRLMAELPPRLIRPRVAAEFVKAVEIRKVSSVGYLAGDQRLDAVIEDAAGERALVSASYRSACPGALDALAEALGGGRGTPRYVSGFLHRTQGGIVIDPLAVVADSELTVIDLSPGDGTGGLEVAAQDQQLDPIEAAVSGALSLLAAAAHQGLRQLPSTFASRLGQAAADLTRCGMTRVATQLTEFAAELGPDPGAAAVAAWVRAQIRLSVTDEWL